MRIVRPLAAFASLSLASTPLLAQSAAAPLSLAPVGAPAESSELRGDFIIPALVLAAIVIGAIIVVADDNDDRPTSP